MCNAKNKIVDKELLKFLKFSYFGNLKNPIEASVNRAYRDMCRTLDFKNITEKDKNNFKEEVKYIFENVIKNENKKHILNNIKNHDEFDTWHQGICDKIIKKSKKIEKFDENYEGKDKIQFTYGQAQKWVNMTIKYLYMLNDHTFDNVFDFLHVPVDNYIFKAVKDELKIKKPTKKSWSRWNNYKEYKEYQNDIRKQLKEEKYISPLRWEFENWLNEAEKEARKVKN